MCQVSLGTKPIRIPFSLLAGREVPPLVRPGAPPLPPKGPDAVPGRCRFRLAEEHPSPHACENTKKGPPGQWEPFEFIVTAGTTTQVRATQVTGALRPRMVKSI